MKRRICLQKHRSNAGYSWCSSSPDLKIRFECYSAFRYTKYILISISITPLHQHLHQLFSYFTVPFDIFIFLPNFFLCRLNYSFCSTLSVGCCGVFCSSTSLSFGIVLWMNDSLDFDFHIVLRQYHFNILLCIHVIVKNAMMYLPWRMWCRLMRLQALQRFLICISECGPQGNIFIRSSLNSFPTDLMPTPNRHEYCEHHEKNFFTKIW